jgi:hypothetical protein
MGMGPSEDVPKDDGCTVTYNEVGLHPGSRPGVSEAV